MEVEQSQATEVSAALTTSNHAEFPCPSTLVLVGWASFLMVNLQAQGTLHEFKETAH